MVDEEIWNVRLLPGSRPAQPQTSPILTALMVLAIGLGIGASMTMLTVLHVLDGDPLPGLSAQLYRPYLNPLPLSFKQSKFGDDPSLMRTLAGRHGPAEGTQGRAAGGDGRGS